MKLAQGEQCYITTNLSRELLSSAPRVNAWGAADHGTGGAGPLESRAPGEGGVIPQPGDRGQGTAGKQPTAWT